MARKNTRRERSKHTVKNTRRERQVQTKFGTRPTPPAELRMCACGCTRTFLVPPTSRQECVDDDHRKALMRRRIAALQVALEGVWVAWGASILTAWRAARALLSKRRGLALAKAFMARWGYSYLDMAWVGGG